MLPRCMKGTNCQATTAVIRNENLKLFLPCCPETSLFIPGGGERGQISVIESRKPDLCPALQLCVLCFLPPIVENRRHVHRYRWNDVFWVCEKTLIVSYRACREEVAVCAFFLAPPRGLRAEY